VRLALRAPISIYVDTHLRIVYAVLMMDPHVHIERTFIIGHAVIRDTIARATGLAVNAPKTVHHRVRPTPSLRNDQRHSRTGHLPRLPRVRTS
jgi:hypothetical protein